MPVYSMTGYAAAQSSGTCPRSSEEVPRAPASVLGIEIRSVNSRFLDTTFKLPDHLRPSEPLIRDLLLAAIKRGKVEVRVWTGTSAQARLRNPSIPELQKILSLQDHIRSWLPTAAPLSVADIMQMHAPQPENSADMLQTLQDLTQTVLNSLLNAREREGERLVQMLNGCLAQLRQLINQAQSLMPQLIAQHRQRFIERWNEALSAISQVHPNMPISGALPPVNEALNERALSEAAAFATRSDVAEEITRLDSHVSEIERLLKKGGHIGKRLDFLIQELHREANTLGAKSSSLELTHIAVEMKVIIEQMREQVQNIE